MAAAVKDKRSIYMAMVAMSVSPSSRRGLRSPDMEAAVIRATSHSERSVDYKNAGRVFAWARASPAFMLPLMRSIARRAERTRSWPVALKALLLAHGLLLIHSTSSSNGRLIFDLSDFRDRANDSWGFTAFVRAYFQFLDNRGILLSSAAKDSENGDCNMDQVIKLQTLLDLLMQIRPYADGMNMGLILEAMDCAVIEIFDVYSGICTGIASFLVDVLGTGSSSSMAKETGEERRRRGLKAISVLRRASEQSVQLTNYFKVCKELGVLNATEFPPVDRIPDEDIMELERFVLSGAIPQQHKGGGGGGAEETEMEEGEGEGESEMKMVVAETVPVSKELIRVDEEEITVSETVISEDWVVFEDEFRYFGNPFVCSPSPDRQWATMVHCGSSEQWNGNLIELM